MIVFYVQNSAVPKGGFSVPRSSPSPPPPPMSESNNIVMLVVYCNILNLSEQYLYIHICRSENNKHTTYITIVGYEFPLSGLITFAPKQPLTASLSNPLTIEPLPIP